jgi:tetratricopeptide (TPR) repeat protein
VVEAETREDLLAEHASQVDLALAYALKDFCLTAWNSDPAGTVRAAAALQRVAQQLDHPEAWALASWASGIVALTEGQMERAVALLEAAIARFAALNQPNNVAAMQVSMLIPLAMLGRYEEAIACGLQAQEVFIACGDELAAGKIELNLGNIYFRRDHYGEAEKWYRAAGARGTLVGDTALVVMADTGLADVLTWQYRFRLAAQLYERALARAEVAGLDTLQALIECDLGWLALARGQYDQALDFLERSRRHYLALDMTFDVALVELKLADAYLEVNLVSEALAIYSRLIPTFAELGLRFEQGWVCIQQGRAYMSLDQPQAARQVLAKARILFEEEGNPVCAALASLFAAQLDHVAGAYQAVVTIAVELEAVFVSARSWGWALLVRWLRGDALRELAQFEAAQKLLEDTFHQAEDRALPQIAWRCAMSLGLLYDQPQHAELWLERAVTIFEDLRAPLPAEEFRTAFTANKLIPYTELARLCLDDGRPERLTAALMYVERARSRALLDLLAGVLPALPKPRDPFEAGLVEQLLELREELNWFYSQLNRLPDDTTMQRAATSCRQRSAHVRPRWQRSRASFSNQAAVRRERRHHSIKASGSTSHCFNRPSVQIHCWSSMPISTVNSSPGW